MKNVSVGFLRMYHDVVLPSFATIGSACFDVRCYLKKENISIPSRSIVAVPTGLKLNIPSGYSVRLHPRSGLSLKGLSLANCEGVIDSDYQDELKVLLINHSPNVIHVFDGDRICQGELIENLKYTIRDIDFHEFNDREESNRIGGLGSTGTS